MFGEFGGDEYGLGANGGLAGDPFVDVVFEPVGRCGQGGGLGAGGRLFDEVVDGDDERALIKDGDVEVGNMEKVRLKAVEEVWEEELFFEGVVGGVEGL